MAFAVLIVPTALMGATLPLVMKASAFRASALGHQVGLLYGSNAAGAIVGTIAAGLYLIPERGIHGTFLVAAGMNLAVGLGAIALSMRTSGLLATSPGSGQPSAPPVQPGAAEPSVEPRAEAQAGPEDLTGRRLGIVLAVFAVSGAVSLALEVVWFRVLTLFLRPTVYGFAVMLAMILVGISTGSFLVTPLLNRRLRWMAVLAGLELAIAIGIVLSLRPLVYLPTLSALADAARGAVHARVPRLSDHRRPAGDFSRRAADGPRVSDRSARLGGHADGGTNTPRAESDCSIR